ncbi:(2Fe-2S)-binding protein [Streptomyces sp. NPDC008141]|uniref:(2Fe-2S)-binding protein n=1 Tax=Streptomyces sp. NPDC008141 TaxID=3364815 RepID=UPI0036EE07B4
MDLTELDAVGGFFALRADPSGGGGAPLARLYAGETAPLSTRIDTVAARLGAGERRVAASVAHLGFAARLWSIALGSAALHGEIPDLDPARLHWAPERSAPDDLWLTGSRSLSATAVTLREAVQYGHLVPFADALRQDTPVSRQLLWGNAGSALAGAVRMLADWARRGGRTSVGERAAALAAELLSHPDLAGTVRGPAMRRSTCCLYYRVPGGGLCGDCVFDRPPRRTPQ